MKSCLKSLLIMKVFLITLFTLFPEKSFSADTLKIYIIGAGFHNKLFIQDQNKVNKVKANAYHMIAVNLILKDSQDLYTKNFYYKYGLFSKKKLLIIPERNLKYLQINFFVDKGGEKCIARWREKEIYRE